MLTYFAAQVNIFAAHPRVFAVQVNIFAAHPGVFAVQVNIFAAHPDVFAVHVDQHVVFCQIMYTIKNHLEGSQNSHFGMPPKIESYGRKKLRIKSFLSEMHCFAVHVDPPVAFWQFIIVVFSPVHEYCPRGDMFCFPLRVY